MYEQLGNWRVSVILPAAGHGERAGPGEAPKQLWRILNKSILQHTLESFARIKYISKIVVVRKKDHSAEINHIIGSVCEKYNKDIIPADGGSTRHRSILNGLNKLDENQDVVIIHDAVRPLIDERIILDVAYNGMKYGACGVSKPLISTVISLNSTSFMDSSLDRQKYRASEMPQAFRFQIIKKAYDMCTDYDFEYCTECLHLVQEYCNICPKILEVKADLWKVTLPRDLCTADRLIKERDVFIELQEELRNVDVIYNSLKLYLKEFKMQTYESRNQREGSSFSNCYLMIYNGNLKSELENWLQRTRLDWGYILIIKPNTLESEGNHEFQKYLSKVKELSRISLEANVYLSMIWNCSQELCSENMEKICMKIKAVLYDGSQAFHEQLISF